MTGFDQGDGQSSMSSVAAEINGTRVWARVLSVMNYIAGVFALCGGLLLAVAGNLVPQMGASGRAIGVVYVVLAFIYVFPAIQLGRVATMSRAFSASSSLTDLASFLQAQRRVFKFYALMMIVGITFGILAFIAVIALGGMAALAGRG